jgi:AcrR family transcriptional regulator
MSLVEGGLVEGGMAAPTRERILDGAWRLFVEQGFAGTTITQIEAAASLAAGSGSFYRHFRSKEDVLHAVVDREVERVDAERNVGPELSDTGGDVRVALAMEFQQRLRNLQRLDPLVRLVQQEREHLGGSRDYLGDLLVDRNVTVRSERFAAWMERGAIPKRDPEALATVLMCALVGYRMSSDYFDRPPGDTSEEAFITTLIDLVAGP